MNRVELSEYIQNRYSASPDFPWAKYPSYEVFRHGSNQKWFAVIMEIPSKKLGLDGVGCLQAVNLKCDPILIGSLLEEAGFFPGYHMNKEHWITAALDGRIPDEKLKILLDMSFDATL